MLIHILLQIDGGAIITQLLESSPVMAVSGLFGWYMHKDGLKKDARLAESEEKREKLNDKLIEGIEKRLLSEQRQIQMLESLVEKTGNLPIVIREAVARLEKNQAELKAELAAMRN